MADQPALATVPITIFDTVTVEIVQDESNIRHRVPENSQQNPLLKSLS